MHVDADSGPDARQPEATPEQRPLTKLYRLHFDNGEFMVLHARDIPEARRLAYVAAAEGKGYVTARIKYVEMLPSGGEREPGTTRTSIAPRATSDR